jgi:hypothetical protein
LTLWEARGEKACGKFQTESRRPWIFRPPDSSPFPTHVFLLPVYYFSVVLILLWFYNYSPYFVHKLLHCTLNQGCLNSNNWVAALHLRYLPTNGPIWNTFVQMYRNKYLPCNYKIYEAQINE